MAYVPDLVKFFVEYDLTPNRLQDVADKAEVFAKTFPLHSNPYNWWMKFAEELRLYVPGEDLTILLEKLGD